MYISSNQPTPYKNVKSGDKNVKNQVKSEKSPIVDAEMAERLRIAFTGFQADMRKQLILNTIKQEFGREMPNLAYKVQKRLDNSQKTLGIG